MPQLPGAGSFNDRQVRLMEGFRLTIEAHTRDASMTIEEIATCLAYMAGYTVSQGKMRNLSPYPTAQLMEVAGLNLQHGCAIGLSGRLPYDPRIFGAPMGQG